MIRAALAGSPGLTEVARFGPAQPPAFRPGDHRAGAAAPDPAAVEVFAVAGAERVTTYPDDGAVALSGGPEGVLSLADAGLLDGRAVMGTIDAAAADAADEDNAANTDGEPPSTLAEAGTGSDEDAVVQTDTQRRRAYNPGADPGPALLGHPVRGGPAAAPGPRPVRRGRAGRLGARGRLERDRVEQRGRPVRGRPGRRRPPRPGPPAGRRGRRGPGHRLGVGVRHGRAVPRPVAAAPDAGPRGDRRPGHRSRASVPR